MTTSYFLKILYKYFIVADKPDEDANMNVFLLNTQIVVMDTKQEMPFWKRNINIE